MSEVLPTIEEIQELTYAGKHNKMLQQDERFREFKQQIIRTIKTKASNGETHCLLDIRNHFDKASDIVKWLRDNGYKVIVLTHNLHIHWS